MVSLVSWGLSSMALQVSLTLLFLAWLVDVLGVQGLGGEEGLGLIGLTLHSSGSNEWRREEGRGEEVGGGCDTRFFLSLCFPFYLSLYFWSWDCLLVDVSIPCVFFLVYASLWMDLVFHHVIHISYWFDVWSCYGMDMVCGIKNTCRIINSMLGWKRQRKKVSLCLW